MTLASETFYARGKLLLTGEYAVLDGARALALPTHAGQQLSTSYWPEAEILRWESSDKKSGVWFSAAFSISDFRVVETTDESVAETLRNVLRHIRRLQPGFLRRRQGVEVKTRLEFDRSWGLGSSSTLIACLAEWAGVDPYALQKASFGGSGYDIACANAEGPLFFQVSDDFRVVRPAPFDPDYHDQLFFVHLGRKQNSRAGINAWRSAGQVPSGIIRRISQISRELCTASTAEECTVLLLEHETLISQHLGMKRAQETYFADFPGLIKSLGAWGGDFVLAVSPWKADKTQMYFQERGFMDFLPYHQMVL